jgi:DNA repair protein RadB
MKTLSNIAENLPKIPTGCSIDNLLDGGIERSTRTQFYGPPGSGKTNISIKIAVECALNGGKVVYIDTEGGLSIKRIKQIAGDKFDDVASNIFVFEPTTFTEQSYNLKKAQTLIESQTENIELLILDSAVALYRLEDASNTAINRELGNNMAILSRVSRKYDVAVVITNQIYSKFNKEGEELISAVGGTVLKYWSKVIIELEKGDIIGERCAILKRHKNKVEGLKTRFRIVENGLSN